MRWKEAWVEFAGKKVAKGEEHFDIFTSLVVYQFRFFLGGDDLCKEK